MKKIIQYQFGLLRGNHQKDPSDIYWDRILYYNDTIQGFIAAKGKSSDEKDCWEGLCIL